MFNPITLITPRWFDTFTNIFTTSNATIFDDGNATFGGNVEALSLTISGVSVNTSTQVDAKIAALETSLTDGAPGALNTLNELDFCVLSSDKVKTKDIWKLNYKVLVLIRKRQVKIFNIYFKL